MANDFLVIGTIGNEKTELVTISSVDSSIQITIGATNFAHNIDDIVSVTPYNQVEWYSSPTKTGTKTTQGAKITIGWDDPVVETNLANVTSGFIFARYYDSVDAVFSAYSPAIDVTGFAENSLRYIIDQARLRTQEETENLVSDEDLLNIAKECSDEIETIRKKWGFVQDRHTFDLTSAVQSYYRPSDLSGPESIERVFLGVDNRELKYFDNKDFWYRMRSTPRTLLTAQITSGSTVMSVKDTSSFGTTGTMTIAGDTGIVYSGKTFKTFTGVTGISATHTSNTEIFRQTDLDQPYMYSWWNEHILVFPVPDKSYGGNIDYYKTIPRMTDVTIQTVVPFPALFIYYLMAEIFMMNNKRTRSGFYFRRFKEGLKLLANKNRNKQGVRFSPAVQYIHKSNRFNQDLYEWRIHNSS